LRLLVPIHTLYHTNIIFHIEEGVLFFRSLDTFKITKMNLNTKVSDFTVDFYE
jgi:hypothetical protein